MKSKVYFTKNITSENLIKLFDALNVKLDKEVAIKLHSGEDGNQNYIKPEFFKPFIDYIDGTVVECNTAYEGARNETSKHKELLKKHGWNIFKTDILDGDGEIEFSIPNGLLIKKNYVGKNIEKYNSMIVLSHFKGHPMGGYGGALKQLSIGCASSNGKCYIHSAGKVNSQDVLWDNIASQDDFLESMADAASSVINYFKGNIAYINVMANISVDCDCCKVAEDPCLPDIGMLSSLDPVALDKACLDLIYNSNYNGKEHFIERVETRNGIHTIESAVKLNLGSTDYELINID
jgi:uncharacterized Fe-S center protein